MTSFRVLLGLHDCVLWIYSMRIIGGVLKAGGVLLAAGKVM